MLLEPASKPESRVLSIEEYIEYVRDHVDVSDFESMCESSWALRALANDRQFLLEAYNREIELILSGTSDNSLTPQSIMLGHDENFYVRANIWLPATGVAAIEDREKKLNSYDVAHDHNFNFLTVGYFGSGYETEVFTYDQSSIIGLEGEDVCLSHSGRFRLIPGTTMAYAAGRHIHIQYPPTDITVSINLMSSIGVGSRQQFAFDLNAQKVASGLTDTTGTRLFLLSILPDVIDQASLDNGAAENTIGLLKDLASNYGCKRTQSQALSALQKVCLNEYENLIPKVGKEIIELSKYSLCHAGQARQIDIM